MQKAIFPKIEDVPHQSLLFDIRAMLTPRRGGFAGPFCVR